MFQAHGIIPALVSPVDDAGPVRERDFRRLIDYQLDNGVHGLFVNGSQGEFYALSAREKREILEITVDQNRGRVPVYAGVGAVTTREAVVLARSAEEVGADALSAITPYFIRPNDQELYDYYRAIAAAVSLPVLLYGNPDRTNVALSTELVARLSDIENIVGIKDSSGDFTLTSEYIRLLAPRAFQVLAGRDTLILATLVYGGVGAIAASANVAPSLAVRIYESVQQGNLPEAVEAQRRLSSLRMAFALGTFPVVIKEALRMMGIDVGSAMRPVAGLEGEHREILQRILLGLQVPLHPAPG
jgi:4-hydroxy-tetrahydrodipicolinate synthase